MTFSDNLLQEFQKTLTRFKEDENKWENHTKAEYIKKCAELVEAQIEAKILPIETSGISSYLYKKLSDFGISCSERTIQRNLPSDLKRNYLKSDTLSDIESDKWTDISSDESPVKVEINQYGDLRKDGIELKPKEVKKEEPKQEVKRKENKETREFVWLSAMSKLANKFHLTLETLKDRYNESDITQQIIDSQIEDVEEKLGQYAKWWASIENSKGMVDLRRDFGEYQKIMAAFMMNTGETIAKIAQLMDYSEKYGSIGILREPRVTEFFEKEDTFPLYLRTCPNCFEDISQVMNTNISYYRECQTNGIEFQPLGITIPIIKYNKES